MPEPVDESDTEHPFFIQWIYVMVVRRWRRRLLSDDGRGSPNR